MQERKKQNKKLGFCNIFHHLTKRILPNLCLYLQSGNLFAKMRTPVLLLVAGLVAFNAALSLKICAFNVQSFGEAKVNNKKVVGILLKVLDCKCWAK